MEEVKLIKELKREDYEDKIMNYETASFEHLVRAASGIGRLITLVETLIKQNQEELDGLLKEKQTIYTRLLQLAKERNLKDEKVGDNYVTYFSKEEVAWLDDVGLLAELKKNDAKQFINTTTTIKESVDKNALKKAFKTDEKLKETYKKFYGTKLTEYVTVTTEENHTKMLEHVEDTKKKGA